jgi:hypothetical protein
MGYMLTFVIGWVIAFLVSSQAGFLRTPRDQTSIARDFRSDARRFAIPAALALLVVVAVDAFSGGGLARLSAGPVGAVAAVITIVVAVFDVVMIRRRARAART